MGGPIFPGPTPGPFILPTVASTGGIIALDITQSPGLNVVTTPIALYRTNQLTSSSTLIYSGLMTPVYIDIGDGLPNYLDLVTPYSYTMIDPGGTYTTSGIVPSGYLNIFSTYIDKLMLRMFTAGLATITVPQGFKKVRVLQAMPLSMGSEGTIFPFIVMNLDLQQQDFLQIGQAITDDASTNLDVQSLIMFRRYSINMCSLNAFERDYYKDVILSIFYGGIVPILNKIGEVTEIHAQAAQSQASSDNLQPGFYVSTIMVELEGIFNYSVDNNFGLIEFIDPDITSTVEFISGSTIVVDI